MSKNAFPYNEFEQIESNFLRLYSMNFSNLENVTRWGIKKTYLENRLI